MIFVIAIFVVIQHVSHLLVSGIRIRLLFFDSDIDTRIVYILYLP